MNENPVSTTDPVAAPSETATTNEQVLVPYTAPKPPSQKSFFNALASALRNGDITSTEAAQLRARLGISKRQFTKKQFNFAKTKRKNKLANKLAEFSAEWTLNKTLEFFSICGINRGTTIADVAQW